MIPTDSGPVNKIGISECIEIQRNKSINGKKWKFSLKVECQLINAEWNLKLQSHHLATPIIIIILANKYQ